MKIIIPGLIRNKANNYQIRINPSLWKRIRHVVEQWRRETRKAPWWIAPSEEVKAYEQEVAWRVKAAETRSFTNGEPLQLILTLIHSRLDIDAVKAVLDSIQASGRIKNDRQFELLIVRRRKGKEPAIEIEMDLLEEKEK